MAGSLSESTTNLTRVQVGGSSTSGINFGFLDLQAFGARLSMATAANSSGRSLGQLTLVFAASGISLMYSSGKSEYIIGGSATSGAQG